jgi:hypothetical protein
LLPSFIYPVPACAAWAIHYDPFLPDHVRCRNHQRVTMLTVRADEIATSRAPRFLDSPIFACKA